MTTLTPESNGLSPFDGDPFYALGVADAYDEHQAGETLQILLLRADEMLDAAPAQTPVSLYVVGYANTVRRLLNEHIAYVNAEADVAQSWLARKQGRESAALRIRHLRPRRTRRAAA